MVLMLSTLLIAISTIVDVKADVGPGPDITVAADGSGDFRTIQAAVATVPHENRERVIILVKDGVYREKVRVDASFVTLRGQSRKGTRIEFAQLASEFRGQPGDPGRAVINLNGNDFVLENLTAANTAGIVGQHAFTIYGSRCDRTVILDCDVLSEGADTVALWDGRGGRYYHARSHFRGAVDFMCPRGWCCITDCTFYETKVKGKPRLVLEGGGYAGYESGSGTDTLVFTAPAGRSVNVTAVDLNGGVVIATEAAATIRAADLTLR